MTIARVFLAVVAVLYIALGIWCAVAPETTSAKVGLSRVGEGGRSEFFTVYGGLEVGIGLALLALAATSGTTMAGVIACLAIHGGLVLFRSISFALYDAAQGFTLRLAIGEWVIFLLSLGIFVYLSRLSR